MPFVESSGASIYWDEQGSGAPLVLIAGLGWSSGFWHRIRPVLRGRYRTIALDNRGVGQSTAAPPYSIQQMASDAVAVLNAARINTAHIFGFAMGGMIAQELALQYPKKVRSLILAGTSPGGPAGVLPDSSVIAVLSTPRANVDEFYSSIRPFAYSAETPQDEVQQDLEVARRGASGGEARAAQLQAILSWESYNRLEQISAPTLVIHGEQDRIVPAENASLLASRIPGATLKLIARAGHLFLTDQPETSQAALLEFLAAQATRKSERATPVLER